MAILRSSGRRRLPAARSTYPASAWPSPWRTEAHSSPDPQTLETEAGAIASTVPRDRTFRGPDAGLRSSILGLDRPAQGRRSFPPRHVTRLFSATREWFGFGPADVWTLFHSYAFDFSSGRSGAGVFNLKFNHGRSLRSHGREARLD